MSPKSNRHTTGRRIAGPFAMPAIRREMNELIAKKMAAGRISPLWAQGVFTRHIAIGLFEPISYCGRYVGNISTEAMPTLIGVVCPTCKRLWNRAMDVHNSEIHVTNERAIVQLADQFDELIGAGQASAVVDLWRESSSNRPLRIAVRERLEERGVDLHAILDENLPSAFDQAPRGAVA